jgi:hypothetical protein
METRFKRVMDLFIRVFGGMINDNKSQNVSRGMLNVISIIFLFPCQEE